MELTREKILEYVINGGNNCPHCGNWPILRGPFNFQFSDNGQGFINSSCPVCDEEWTEEYRIELTWITEEINESQSN